MTTLSEQTKYEQMWQQNAYRNHSPGEECTQVFLGVARPKHGSAILDVGTGTGRGALSLALFGGLNVTMLDFAANCLDDDIRPMLATQSHVMRFIQHDITKEFPVAAPYAFCADVMEHIPTEDVRKVLGNILHAAQHCFFQIATVPDNMGALIGEPLHLTVKPFAWWLDQFKALDCTVHWSEDLGNAARFYVTAWIDGQAVVDAGVLNCEEEQVLENVRTNTARRWRLMDGDTYYCDENGKAREFETCQQAENFAIPSTQLIGLKPPPLRPVLFRWNQVQPHITNDLECMIVGGGPSAKDNLEEIRNLRAAGVKLITLNGAYNWCLENGLTPSAQIMVDARPFNARFTKPVIPDCRYLIASQCDPSVFEGLPHDRTFIWHTLTGFTHEALDEAYDLWWGIPSGSTVFLRSLSLMRMLGYRKFICFGCDSCLGPADETHSYSQPENSSDFISAVNVEGRMFRCLPYHIAQAEEFMMHIKLFGDEIDLDIRGDGLLAWIVQVGYDRRIEAIEKMRAMPKTGRKGLAAKRRRRM